MQVELSPFHDVSLLNGVVWYCLAHAIPVLAYRPFGGAARRARLQSDPLLSELAAQYGVTPADIALAWLADLSPLIVPLPGPTRIETAALLGRARSIAFTSEERARLDERFPAGQALRGRRQAQRRAAHRVVRARSCWSWDCPRRARAPWRRRSWRAATIA